MQYFRVQRGAQLLLILLLFLSAFNPLFLLGKDGEDGDFPYFYLKYYSNNSPVLGPLARHVQICYYLIKIISLLRPHDLDKR